MKSIQPQQSTNTPVPQETLDCASIDFTGSRMRMISFSQDKLLNVSPLTQVLNACKLAGERASAEPSSVPTQCASVPAGHPSLGSSRSGLIAGVQNSSGYFSFLSVCGCGDFMRGLLLLFGFDFFSLVQCSTI